MIELMFPQTVSNILDYDGIKAAAKKYVEDIFVQIIESFGNNLVLQSMDGEHLAEVAGHVTGDPKTTLEELLNYINTSNTYHEFEFVDELTTAFPEGVEYKEFEVTGWQFPNADFPPFSEPDRSYNYDGTPQYGGSDDVWMENAMGEEGVHNLMMSRFRGNYFDPEDYESITWFKTSGRRASWGNEETWMTTGGFGKPSTIHINVDEVRTVIEKNGLSSVENWLGTVSNKLPINLYIEINDQLRTYDADDDVSGLAGSTEGYPMAFPYEEEEGFCTNDPDWPGPEPEPEPALPTVSTTWLAIGGSVGNVIIVPNGDHIGYWWDEGSQSYIPATWDSTVTYGIIAFYTTPFAYAGRIGLEIKEVNNTIGVLNVSSSSITVCQAKIAVCSSSSATVITVYDSSNNPYNAFQYTSDGTDYYYVLDGTQTDWTDDLSGIGYHLPPILPTVSSGGFIMHNNPVTITAGATNSDFYIGSTGQPFVYDSTKSYGARRAMDAIPGGNDIDPTVFALVDSSGELAVKNISRSSVTVEAIYVSVCSSSDATIITVYDSNNNHYNAFKYTSDGTDYYYVLDGVQTDWTDDLASIGYGLQQIYKAWLESNKSQTTIGYNVNKYLYNGSGAFYVFEFNTDYSILSIDGDRTSENIDKLEIINTWVGDNRLGLKIKSSRTPAFSLTYIEFTMTPTT